MTEKLIPKHEPRHLIALNFKDMGSILVDIKMAVNFNLHNFN